MDAPQQAKLDVEHIIQATLCNEWATVACGPWPNKTRGANRMLQMRSDKGKARACAAMNQ